jgi:protocatechuate 3,4-dioxygenase beta subunit
VNIDPKTARLAALFVVIAALIVGVLGFIPGLGGPAAGVLTAAEKRTCGITAEVTEGPYYVSDTAGLSNGNLNYSVLPGERLEVSGFVYDGTDTSKPLANAKIEIWHADNGGSYHPNGNGKASSYATGDIALRGFILTGADGSYAFNTIYPGEYSGRTRHIHFKISAAGFPELTTQLIMPAKPGDRLTFDDDTVSQGLPDCQLLKVDVSTAPATASFDFHLTR